MHKRSLIADQAFSFAESNRLPTLSQYQIPSILVPRHPQKAIVIVS